MAFSLMGESESTEVASDIFGALDRHGLAPQFVTGANVMDTIADGPFLHLTDTVPRDHDMIEGNKARLLAALPDVFNLKPDFIGLV